MRYYLFYLLLLSGHLLFAQAPQGISYQAIAFNLDGTAISDGTVGVRVSLIDGSPTGAVVYSESHVVSTNVRGLYNFNIGQGVSIIGSFDLIDWGVNSKYLKVEVDPIGGENYTTSGVSQLMSAPYALYAENVNSSNLPVTLQANNKTSEVIVIYTSTNAYGFSRYSSGGNSSGEGVWRNISLSGPPIGAIASDESIVVYTSTNAYGFSRYSSSGNSSGVGVWRNTSLSGSPIGAIASDESIVVYTSTNAYGFSRYSSSGNSSGEGVWRNTSLSGVPIDAIASSESIVVYTSTNAYGFSRYSSSGNSTGEGVWRSTSLSGVPLDAIASSESIAVYTSSNAYGFSRYNEGGNSAGQGVWRSISLLGSQIKAISR